MMLSRLVVISVLLVLVTMPFLMPAGPAPLCPHAASIMAYSLTLTRPVLQFLLMLFMMLFMMLVRLFVPRLFPVFILMLFVMPSRLELLCHEISDSSA